MTGIMLDSTSPNAIGQAVAERREWRGMPIKAAALYLDGAYAAPASVEDAVKLLGVPHSTALSGAAVVGTVSAWVMPSAPAPRPTVTSVISPPAATLVFAFS